MKNRGKDTKGLNHNNVFSHPSIDENTPFTEMLAVLFIVPEMFQQDAAF